MVIYPVKESKLENAKCRLKNVYDQIKKGNTLNNRKDSGLFDFPLQYPG
jgi:hypothetical protein